jgi:hypothetical protein
MADASTPDLEKSAPKSAVPGVPFVPNDPRSGRGPAPGAPNAGRPPNAFAEQCKTLQRDVILPKCEAVLRDPTKGPKDADWQWATRWISKYGEKETAKRFEHGGLDGGPILLEQIMRERAEARRDAEGASE